MIFAGSVMAGVIGALLGLGGGIIIIPLLTLAFGIDIRYAIGASIVAVIATSSGAASSYVHDRISNIRVGMFLVIATTTGAVAGAFLVSLISPP
ncbi:MAG: TSUP family transporter, partial [Moorella sp. (in: Bacteria)]|nr:TSUP family transporter [Moorella sp. (in: firmicutes)]